MQIIDVEDITCQRNWSLTDSGEPRGYIQTPKLRELWFHTGTACNLSCPFCLEGSRPGDYRLQRVTLADVQPFIDEALALGVEKFSFTGGEPFVVRELHRILAYAARHRPCLVLTNATAPLRRRLSQLADLAQTAHPIRFRVSIDYPDKARHEAGRGVGTFEESLSNIEALQELGFAVSVARQWRPGEDTGAVESAFRRHFRQAGLPEDIHLVSFPDFHPPDSIVKTPEITENCMTTYHTALTRADFMCAFSRMVVKQDGGMRVFACTLVDDDPDYDLGGTLAESLKPRVMLGHHRCYSCFRLGASCSEAS